MNYLQLNLVTELLCTLCYISLDYLEFCFMDTIKCKHKYTHNLSVMLINCDHKIVNQKQHFMVNGIIQY